MLKTTTYVQGNPKPMEHFMEGAVRGMGFILIKDGTQYKAGVNFLKEENPTVYVKIYQLKLDGRPQALKCRFVYDLRDNTSSCEFKPSIGECMNAIAHMVVAEDVKIEEVNW